jgi:hypothetical protein
MPAKRHPLRSRTLAGIKSGRFATVSEIMMVASIPRQTANRWLREAGIKLADARLRRLAKMRSQEERYLEGLPPLRRPSKPVQHQAADRAKAKWDRDHGASS